MLTTSAQCIVLAKNAPRVLRNRIVTTLDEVAALHEELPRNDIGVTWEGIDWVFFPELDDPNYVR